ncbi:hypothetical protein [Roseovarius sp. SYSU LYC5161]|jgi:hypothetical protein|uniref:hypothetical protein n=1 Tax=Roseovarius halophilus (ex Wu et al. 2025) TaxID=3376060 RepID=UPI00399A3D1C
MSNQRGGKPADQEIAAERIKEARQLNRSINETLNRILADLQAGRLDEVRDLATKQKQLETALAQAQKLEAQFNERFGTGLESGEIDVRRVRLEIGCRLARIRRCCREKGLPQADEGD